jgi:hypothetical protein
MTPQHPAELDDELVRVPGATAAKSHVKGVGGDRLKSAASGGAFVVVSSSVSDPVQHRCGCALTNTVPPWAFTYCRAAGETTTSTPSS